MTKLSEFLRTRDAGQALVLIALILLVLMMFVGLAVDAGQLYSARRTMQEAADAAAYAGAVVVYQNGGDPSPAASGICGLTVTVPTSPQYLAAVNDATTNGFTNGVAGTTVTINNPPRAGPYCGDARYVEVIIQAQVRTTLVPAEAGLNTVRVRGVAGAEPLNNGYAIMALNKGSGSPSDMPNNSSFYADNNADIHLTGGGILVNATNSYAAYDKQTDCSRFTIQAPYGIDVTGGAQGFPSCPAPNNWVPSTSQPQVPDPFAILPPPPTTGLPTCTSLSSSGCQDASGHQNPGIYKVSLQASGGSTITLNPGIFILEAGINASGNSDIVTVNDATCQGPPNVCGVLLFNTLTNYPNSGGTCGPINLTGNNTTTLNAVSGRPLGDPMYPYNNLLIWQDIHCSQTMNISGNGTLTATGSVYIPGGEFFFDGNNATLNGSQLVAKYVNVQGGNININFDASTTAQPILPRLSE